MQHFVQQGTKERPESFLCLSYMSIAMVVMCHTASSPGATGETVPSLSDGAWTQMELERRMQICKSQEAGVPGASCSVCGTWSSSPQELCSYQCAMLTCKRAAGEVSRLCKED